jgi:hypothetical protein
MSLCSFYNCSSFWTSFKASSRDVNCVLTSASCYANTAYFFCSSPCSPWICTSLLLSTLNSSFMQALSKTHTAHSRSNFWWPSLEWYASCWRSSYFEVRVVRSRCNSIRFKLDPPTLPASWISPSNLGRLMSNFLGALAPSSSSNLDPLFAKQIAFPTESSSRTIFIDLEVFWLAPCASGAGPIPTLCSKVLKLSGTCLSTYSVLSPLFLVNSIR